LVWRAPTQLDLPVVTVLPYGTYLTIPVKPTIRGGRRQRLLTAARDGLDLDDINTVPRRSTTRACRWSRTIQAAWRSRSLRLMKPPGRRTA
jgi:hypothetical protein